MKRSVREHLEKQHSLYCDYNQTERESCRLMAELGHPNAAGYRKLRRLFDSLKYAANASARYFSFVDEKNYAQMWAPKLDITWNNAMEIDGQFYYEVYPAKGEVFDKYVRINAEQNWKKANPSLNVGGVVIRTTSREMAEAVAETTIGQDSRVSLSPEGDTYSFHLFPRKVMEFYELLRVIKAHHKGYVLPKRTAEDDSKDKAELPMNQKTVMLANVEEPVVKERSVLIPLIPLNDAGQEMALRNVKMLESCLEEGLHWDQAEPHLSRVLRNDSYQAMKRKYA